MNVIETERLLLEPLDMSRLEEFVALTAEADTMRYWAPDGPFSRGVAERNFEASLARLREHDFGRRWIVDKETGAGLGFTEARYFGGGYVDVSPDEVEIGWMLMPPVWGRGYATEAVMKKLGMEFERDVVAGNGWPARLYRLTREQWSGEA